MYKNEYYQENKESIKICRDKNKATINERRNQRNRNNNFAKKLHEFIYL
jgi:hypothetical protein